MARVILQAGHAGRTSGSTGAPDEQKWTSEMVPQIASKLRERGIEVLTVNADPIPGDISGDWDLFLSVHYDADIYNDRGGFIDTPDHNVDFATKESNRIAQIMRKHYFPKTGIPEHPERSNKNTRFYYMWERMSAKTPCVILEAGVGFRVEEDHKTLHFKQDLVAQAIADGIIEAVLGADTKPPVDTCADQLATKDKQIAAYKGKVTEAENKSIKIQYDLDSCNLKLKEEQNKPGNPVEAVKDPIRYVVSMVIAALLTQAYAQYPFLGEMGIDQQALATALIGLAIKGMDKYQHETGSNLKLPF